MKWISFQLQPYLNLDIRITDVIEVLNKKMIVPEIQEGDDNGIYINVNFKTQNPIFTWLDCRTELFNCIGFKESSIVTCEGECGWDDYLLLHHFDPKEKLNNISVKENI